MNGSTSIFPVTPNQTIGDEVTHYISVEERAENVFFSLQFFDRNFDTKTSSEIIKRVEWWLMAEWYFESNLKIDSVDCGVEREIFCEKWRQLTNNWKRTLRVILLVAKNYILVFTREKKTILCVKEKSIRMFGFAFGGRIERKKNKQNWNKFSVLRKFSHSKHFCSPFVYVCVCGKFSP